MKKLIAFTAAMLAIMPLMGNQYFGLDFGTNHAESTNDAKSPKIGAKFGARYGYAFDSGIRAEFHVTHRINHHKTDYSFDTDERLLSKITRSVRSWSYMANALYDITQMQMYTVVPYVGAGIGYCQNTDHVKMQSGILTNRGKEKDNRFAWQGIVGAKYAINAQMTTGIEYHYFCGKSHVKEHSFGVVLARNF